jgi:hypothetical protein
LLHLHLLEHRLELLRVMHLPTGHFYFKRRAVAIDEDVDFAAKSAF